MNVEDSYEGAVRRLNRLSQAGLALAPPPPESDESEDRLRDLEELATLACEQNERLTQELGEAQGEIERLTRERGDHERLTRELRGTRGEIERLQRLTATLQEMLAGAQSDERATPPDQPRDPHEMERLSHELGAAHGEIERLQRLVTTLQEMLAGAQPDEPLTVPKQSRTALYVFAVAVLGGAAAFLLMLRPAQRHPIPEVAVAAAPPVAPLVAVAPAPKVEATITPKVEPIVPKVAATIPKVEPTRVASPKAGRRHAPKHHASKSARHKQHKSSSVAKSNKVESRGDDPLGGLEGF